MPPGPYAPYPARRPPQRRSNPSTACMLKFVLAESAMPCVRPSSPLCVLPDDVLLVILSYLEVKDILSLRQTSMRLYSMTKLRWVWYDAMKNHVIAKGLPVPAPDANLWTCSAEQLEARAVHAAKFHDNWCSPQPQARRVIKLQTDRSLPDEPLDHRTASVKYVFFLPGRNGELLITVAGRAITCWEVPLDGSGAYVIAEFVASHKVDHAVVNDDPENVAVVAFTSKDPPANPQTSVITILALDIFHGCFKVVRKMRVAPGDLTPLHVMHGDYLIFGEPTIAWYFTEPSDVAELPRPDQQQFVLANDIESNQVVVVKPLNRYMLIIREHSFQLVFAPLWNGVRASYTPIFHQVCARLTAELPTREAVVTAKTAAVGNEGVLDWPDSAVSILIRVHHDGVDTIRQTDLLPLLRSHNDKDFHPADFRIPCILPDDLSGEALVVPPSSCGLTVASNGKGYWIQTQNITSQHSVYPARCLVGFHLSSARSQATRRKGDAEEDTDPSADPSTLHLCKGVLYSRRCDMSEIIWRKYQIVSTALEDAVGRLAIGDRAGCVEIVDFV